MPVSSIFMGFLALVFFLWSWAFWDISRLRFRSGQNRFIWYLIILVFPILGPIIFFQAKRRITKSKRDFHSDFR